MKETDWKLLDLQQQREKYCLP